MIEKVYPQRRTKKDQLNATKNTVANELYLAGKVTYCRGVWKYLATISYCCNKLDFSPTILIVAKKMAGNLVNNLLRRLLPTMDEYFFENVLLCLLIVSKCYISYMKNISGMIKREDLERRKSWFEICISIPVIWNEQNLFILI